MIETERLLLRRVDPERDFEPWARTMADERVVRFLGAAPMGRALAWRHMASIVGHWAIRGYGFFSVVEKATGEWVGRVGPWYPEGWPAPEIGWTLSPDHWGKGFATEAGRAAVAYAFETLHWPAVAHVILAGNTRSIAVAERLGARFLRAENGLDGVTDGQIVIYGRDAPRGSGALDAGGVGAVGPAEIPRERGRDRRE